MCLGFTISDQPALFTQPGERALDRPRIVVANKMDEPQAEENLKTFKRKVSKIAVQPISAAFDQGIDKCKQTIREAVEEASVK